MRTLARLRINLRQEAPLLLAIVAVLVAPVILPGQFVSLGFIALQYMLFGLGLNVVVGWTGLLDLGSAGFVAVGAYTTAILSTQFGLSPLIIIVVVLVFGVAMGLALGFPTLRHRHDYFAVLTLGFAELVAQAIRNWPAVTRGSYGYSGIPATRIPFVSEPFKAVPPVGFYYMAAILVLLAYLVLRRVRASSLGQQFHLVKHSEVVCQSYGNSVWRIKMIAFGISAGIIACGGFLWASYQRSIVWTEFGVLLSCILVCTLVVGGIGNLLGVLVGSAVVGVSLEVIRQLLVVVDLPGNTRYLVFALALLAFIHFRPAGLIPDRPSWSNRTLGRRFAKVGPARTDAGQPGLSVEIEKLTKRYGGLIALDQVSVHFESGECVALVGPNGSGKTTLVNSLLNVVRPDGGTVLFDDQQSENIATHKLARMGIRRSFQDLSVFDDISSLDNVLVANSDCSLENAKKALAKFQLVDDPNPVADLSYGSKKMLDLARVFATEGFGRLYILDEPTAGLTRSEGSYVVQCLREIRETTGATMLVISHDMMFLEQLEVDRVVVLQAGRVIANGPMSEVLRHVDVKRALWGIDVRDAI